MLKRHNRIVSPNDFRQVVRRGHKHVMAFVIVFEMVFVDRFRV
jgi:hypothetical protein